MQHSRRPRCSLSFAIGILASVGVLLLSGTAIAAGPDPLDPDQSAKVSTDVDTSLMDVGDGTYRLLVQNQSGYGAINSFAWVPGPGWHIKSVGRTSQGSCVVRSGALACTGVLKPPTNCLCQAGGQMTITFKMTGPKAPPPSAKNGVSQIGTAGGYIVVKTVTLTKRHIPTSPPSV